MKKRRRARGARVRDRVALGEEVKHQSPRRRFFSSDRMLKTDTKTALPAPIEKKEKKTGLQSRIGSDGHAIFAPHLFAFFPFLLSCTTPAGYTHSICSCRSHALENQWAIRRRRERGGIFFFYFFYFFWLFISNN